VTSALQRSKVDEAIATSLTALRGTYRTPESGAAGWYHFLDDAAPGITASAIGLYIFQLAGEEFESSDDVVAYLVSQQIQSGQPGAGGWAVRTTGGFPIVEATAWVVRSLTVARTRNPEAAVALATGVDWLTANQNADFGWGSYKGQPSRTFLTALTMLALIEAGSSPSAIANAQRWLISAQDPGSSGWPAVPGTRQEPTLLHTAWALMVLSRIPGSISQDTLNRTVAWMADRVDPTEMVEEISMVEEYDVPFLIGDRQDTFQNALPHFAMPLAMRAVMEAGADPLTTEIFTATRTVLEAQRLDGSWKLPRSPNRPSIWAIWPQIAMLSSIRRAVLPTRDAELELLAPGTALLRSSRDAPALTRRLIRGRALSGWLRARKWPLLFVLVAGIYATLGIVLFARGSLSIADFTTAVVSPVVLAIAAGLFTLWRDRGVR
jgi:hypothetical protein